MAFINSALRMFTLVGVLLVTACGGSGGSSASSSGSSLTGATFSNQVPGGAATMQAMQLMMMGGFGISTDSKIASANSMSDFLYGLFGIRTAIAANVSLNNLIYTLDTQGKLSSLNLIESIDNKSGSRSTVSLDLLSPGTNSLALDLQACLIRRNLSF